MHEKAEDDLYGEADPSAGEGGGSMPPATKLENIAALGKNPKTSRVILATAGAVALVGGIAIVSIVSKNRKPPEQPPASISGAAVGAAPSGLSETRNDALTNSQEYNDIIAAAGKKRAADASQAGESVQPLAASVESSLKPALTPAEQAASAAASEQLRLQAEAAERARIATMNSAQPQGGSGGGNGQQQVDPMYQQQITNAQNAMAQLMQPRTRGTAVYSMVAQVQGASNGVQQVAYQPSGQMQAGQAGGQATTASAAATPTQYTLLSAGMIETARVDTAMNTDIGGDFGATLMTGKYAGAKLIGTYTRKAELAAGQVRMMSFPDQGVSVPVSAIILDVDTSEGGTATDVDRKLLVKYGIKPIAAGFAAVADYLKNGGTTVVVNGETVTTSQPELTNKRAGQIIVGSAAQQVNSDANALDTTPTVRVKRGALVGIFFTQDVLYTPRQTNR